MASAGLAACGDAPDEKAEEKNDFLPCILSDAGGFNDKSFNQLSYEGVQDAAEELNSEFKEFESKNENDYAGALEGFVSAGCDAIVTVGLEQYDWLLETVSIDDDGVVTAMVDAATLGGHLRARISDAAPAIAGAVELGALR